MADVVGFRSSRLAPAALLLMAMLWGSTLIVMKDAYEHMDAPDLLANRFALAAVAFGVLFPRAWRTDLRTAGKGVVLGLLFGAGQLLQAVGLTMTPASVNGFIAGLYVVVTPLIGAVLFGKKVSGQVWGAVALATVGLGSLALNPSALGAGIGWGEVLTFASAVAFAAHIVATGRFATARTVASLGLYQTLTVAVVCALFALPGGITPPTTVTDWTAVVYLGLVCGTLTVFLQSWAQARVEANRAAVIMCTEPLWGAVFAIGFASEALTGRILFGGLTILAAMYLVVRPPHRRRGMVGDLDVTLPERPELGADTPRLAFDRML